MPKFRATTNLPGLRAGQVIEGNATDPDIAARLRAKTLVPVGGAPAAPVAPPTPPTPVDVNDDGDNEDKSRGRKS